MKIKLVIIFIIISTSLLYSQNSSKLLFSIEVESNNKYYNSFYIADNIDSIPSFDLIESLSDFILLMQKSFLYTDEPLIGIKHLNTEEIFLSEKEYMTFIKKSRKLLKRFKLVGTIKYSIYERISIEVVELDCQLTKSLIRENDIFFNDLILDNSCSELKYRMIISNIISSNIVGRRILREIKSKLIQSPK